MRSVSTRNSWRPWKRSRSNMQASIIHALTPDGVAAVFRPTMTNTRASGALPLPAIRIMDFALQTSASGASVEAAVTGDLHRAISSRSISPARPHRCHPAGARRSQRAQRAGCNCSGAGCGRVARRHQTRPSNHSGAVKGPPAGQARRALDSLAGATVIDDTYNANPDSMRAAIDVLASRAAPSPRVLVMGDMGEVGDNGPAFHREIGAYTAQRARRRRVVRVGRRLAPMPVTAFGSDESRAFHRRLRSTRLSMLNCSRRGLSDPAATLLVKGSRFMKMERVVDARNESTTHPHRALAPGAH